MDKKQTTIVAIISAVIVIAVVAVAIISESKPRMKNDEVISVDGKIYTSDDLIKYSYIKAEDEGDINKVLSDAEKEEVCNNFLTEKMYAGAAITKKIVYPSGEKDSALNTYETKKDVFAQYDISSGDYLAYAEDKYLYETLARDFDAYYDLSEEVYQDIVSQFSGDDLKTYSYRRMMFRYEEPESGDSLESGDVIGDTLESEDVVESGDATEEPKEDRSIETMRAKAESALEQVRNGSDFEEVAKENADMDYIFSTNGLEVLNGQIEYSIAPFLEQKLTSVEIREKIKSMAAGEISDVILDEESKRLYIIKLENVEDGFVGKADEELRAGLLLETQDGLVMESIKVETNQSGMMKYLYR